MLLRRLSFLLPLLAALVLSRAVYGAGEPLEPEKAFRMSASVVAPGSVQVVFEIEPGYYLYRDKFRFEAPPPAQIGSADIPRGEKKHDVNFGEVETHRGRLVIALPVQGGGKDQFDLTVVSQGCADLGVCYPPTPQTVRLDLSRISPPPPAAASGDESGRIAGLLKNTGLWGVLAFFFTAGLLLAFTPCMFPMIPILSSIIVGHGHAITRARALVLSGAYVFGMAVTYALAGVAAGLSGTLLAGALQNAWVLGSFAAIFVLLSFAMFGFYDLQLPGALQSRMADSANARGGSLAGVLVMGVLSALIVGPCVAAPLAGALLYIAQTGNAVQGGLALFVMALGMGLPLVAVGLASRTLLPKSGPWMEAVKKSFGVLLLAVALWMVAPLLPAQILMFAWAVLFIVPAIYLHALDPLPAHAGGWHKFWKGVGVIALLAGASLLVGALAGSRDPLQPLGVLRGVAAAGAEQPAALAPQPGVKFERVASVEELEQRLASTDRPVMLDFYADWCVSCKEMERFTFADPKVAGRMANMLVLQADVTANNAQDRALLRRFALFGPPGIVFFDRGGREIGDLRVVGFQDAAQFSAVLDRALAS
ncbi:MAG: protein-disulfide reductase DsbD [Rhodocyclaceae bacterium]|nr:protein-disulfide reductase DsbD [Rhodocyclaceae bacterium]MBX3669138.1 protein-disulfide reductase DsbD [Rhodocyclaceae bacterium]